MMTKISLVALDLDGTLLTSSKEISPGNRRALEKCVEHGVWIVPCTGRTWAGVPDFLKSGMGVRYAITTNGARVEDVQEQKVIDTRNLSLEKALEILEIGKHFHTMYDPYIEGRALTERRFIEHMDEFGITPVMQKLVHKTRDIVPNIMETMKQKQRPVEKINFFFGDMEEKARVREALLQIDGIVISSSLYNNLEINAEDATKGGGILRLAKYLGLPRESTMACGDGENDITMIRDAGIGVAMGNAEDYLKESADFVTLTNDEDGVAAAIEKFVLD